MSGIAWLQKTDPPSSLPPTSRALTEPNGLLAVGGALTPEWLIHAYRHGVFPWFSAEQPILWWAPDPRAVLLPGEFRISRSLARSIARRGYETRIDTAFTAVIEACAGPRRGMPGHLDHPRDARRPTCSCTAAGSRIRSRPGTRGAWSADSMA